MRSFVVLSAAIITIALIASGSTVLGMPILSPDCTSGIAVPDAASNRGLVYDCEVLRDGSRCLIGPQPRAPFAPEAPW